MLRVGLSPSGVEPCSRNRSTLVVKVLASELFKPGSIGFNGGTSPSSEPGLATPPLPSGPWQVTQLAVNTSAPLVTSPVMLTASPGPPPLDGLAASPAAVSVGFEAQAARTRINAHMAITAVQNTG